MSRCGSNADPLYCALETFSIFITSTSPAFSLGVPGFIQVLVAQISEPHRAMRTLAFPSLRAQLPFISAAIAASPEPRTKADAISNEVFMTCLLVVLIVTRRDS